MGEIKAFDGSSETADTRMAPGFIGPTVGAPDGMHKGEIGCSGKVKFGKALDDGGFKALGFEKVYEVFSERGQGLWRSAFRVR